MNNSTAERQKSYFKKLLSFYFAPAWQSFFTILYLVFFSYFAIFHSGKIVLAFKFILYTLKNSTLLLGLEYLFWGVMFLITLIIPFSVSLYSILLFYEMWTSNWDRSRKLLVTALIIVAIPIIVITMDEIIRLVASQETLREFVVTNQLRVSGK